MFRSLILTTCVFFAFATDPSIAQDASKNVLTIDDYARWRSIGSTSISEQGDWITFSYSKRETDDELHVKQLDSDKEHVIERGARPKFSDDSKWVAYRLNPPEAGKKDGEESSEESSGRGRRGGSSRSTTVELLDLETGKKKASWDNGSSYDFSKGSGVLAVKTGKSSKDAKHDGTDLILRRLDRGDEELIGSVSQYAFNKPGTMLAYTVDAADKNGNGVYLMHLDTGMRRPLDNAKARYARLTWDEEGTALAVLRGDEKKGYVRRENALLTFTDLDAAEPTETALLAKESFGFPRDMVISEKADLRWAEPPTRVFLGIKEQEKEDKGSRGSKEGKKPDPVADLDIWHWNDDRIQSVQMVRANRDRDFTWRSVFNLAEKKFVRLCDETMRTISVTRDGRWGVGKDDREYLSDWEEERADYSRVDTATGKRTTMLTAQGALRGSRRGGGGMSPDSRHYPFWRDGHIWIYDLDTTETWNLTANAPVSFVNAEYDHPGTKPPYGIVGWTEGGVVLSHRYDLWWLPIDGSDATNLTRGVGTKEETRFRYVRTDTEEKFIDVTRPMLLTSFGEWTKSAGFYRLEGESLERLMVCDRNFGRVTKAKHADRFLYTIETFRDYPDYYVSDGGFHDPKRVTDANPWQLEYKWGRRILFDFENPNGVRLQGTLAIPDSYAQGDRLPMVVNFYEKNSQNLHRYPRPRYASSPNFAGYVSAGYLVMQPDIQLDTGTTHSDMLVCVEAAVRKVIELGYADPDRIALHGHSFSGQGAAYIATQSKLFAAIVCGAAATNLVSDFNQLWKDSGTSQHRYDIYGQGRFGTNPYDDLELYQQQSAVYNVRDVETPLLLLHGTKDGAVEWLQAVEFYNALRFNGKEVILLSYPGEGHGLRKFENQKDFQVRMRQFLGHHLKGELAADWIRNGVDYLDKKKKSRTKSGPSTGPNAGP